LPAGSDKGSLKGLESGESRLDRSPRPAPAPKPCAREGVTKRRRHRAARGCGARGATAWHGARRWTDRAGHERQRPVPRAEKARAAPRSPGAAMLWGQTKSTPSAGAIVCGRGRRRSGSTARDGRLDPEVHRRSASARRAGRAGPLAEHGEPEGAQSYVDMQNGKPMTFLPAPGRSPRGASPGRRQSSVTAAARRAFCGSGPALVAPERAVFHGDALHLAVVVAAVARNQASGSRPLV
jgi:hypothetical protein